uniref:Uncharacterized protein n=1 Tax=Picea sitchensis TaxID=3332 RepID=A9P1B5_PICSI|nr:unknown [Picea sitchensis]
MAFRPRVRSSEAHEQRNNPEKQQQQDSRSKALSWLFGGRKSKDGSEENNNNFPQGHTTVQPSAKGGERHAADSGEVSDEGKVSHDGKPQAADSVDKEAENFIARQRKKLEMERLISLKRVESMLNRGL